MVAAMCAFLKKDYPNLITCEMVCEGSTTAIVRRRHIEHREKKFDSKMVDFSVRRKRDVWTPKHIYAKYENGTVYKKEFRRTKYGFAFNVKGKSACYQCKFKANGRTGDIMLGDYWAATQEDPFWNKNGVSVIFVHTEKGHDILKQTDVMVLFSSDFKRAVTGNPMVIRLRKPRPEKEKLEKLFVKKGLIYTAKHSRTLECKTKDFLLDFMQK